MSSKASVSSKPRTANSVPRLSSKSQYIETRIENGRKVKRLVDKDKQKTEAK